MLSRRGVVARYNTNGESASGGVSVCYGRTSRGLEMALMVRSMVAEMAGPKM